MFPAGYPDCELDAKYEEGYVVRQGGVIRLSVPIRGKPIPSCKWTKDGRDIAHRAMIASNDEVTELVIKEAHKDDTGSYDLVLENKCGKKAVYIKVRGHADSGGATGLLWDISPLIITNYSPTL